MGRSKHPAAGSACSSKRAGMKGTCGILGRLFSAVARKNISVIAVAQGASGLNICFSVAASRANQVVKAVHQEFL
jgi:aspartokinase